MPLQAISLTHRKKGFRGFCDFRCFGNLTDQSNRALHASLVEPPSPDLNYNIKSNTTNTKLQLL